MSDAEVIVRLFSEIGVIGILIYMWHADRVRHAEDLIRWEARYDRLLVKMFDIRDSDNAPLE